MTTVTPTQKTTSSLPPKRQDGLVFFKRLSFAAKYPPLPDERGEQALDERALERYRALDPLASMVFQTGLALFVGGVAIALTVHSIPYRITIGTMGIPPFCSACTAGMAMLELANADPETPTFHDLRRKRLSVESSGFWLVMGILLDLIAILLLLALTNKLA
jgi:hypothetical protein